MTARMEHSGDGVIRMWTVSGDLVYEDGPVAPIDAAPTAYETAVAERDQLRRWIPAVTLGRATKETHAEMREYLRRIGW